MSNLTAQQIAQNAAGAAEPNVLQFGGTSINPWPPYKGLIIALANLFGPINGSNGLLRLNSQGSIPPQFFAVPKFTTAERNAIASPTGGQVIINTTTNFFEVWNDDLPTPAWVPFALYNSTGLGLTQTNTVIATALAAGATATFNGYPAVSNFFDVQSLIMDVTNTAGIANFDIAVYASAAQLAAAVLANTVFDPANATLVGGLVYLALAVTNASAGPAEFRADVLGRFYSNETPPSLSVAVRNNDPINAGDFTLRTEQYPQLGQKV